MAQRKNANDLMSFLGFDQRGERGDGLEYVGCDVRLLELDLKDLFEGDNQLQQEEGIDAVVGKWRVGFNIFWSDVQKEALYNQFFELGFECVGHGGFLKSCWFMTIWLVGAEAE